MKYLSVYIKKLISSTMLVIESCISTLREDLQLLLFFIFISLPELVIKIRTGMAIFNLKTLFFNLAWFSLIIALSYNYKTKKTRTIYLCVITSIIYILTYGNLLYYQFYTDFLSLSLIKQIGLFFDVADATTVNIALFDLFYWIAFVIILLIIIYAPKIKPNQNFITENRVFYRLNFLRVALVVFVLGISMLAPANYSQAQKFWNRPIVVEDFGLLNYHILDIYQSIDVFITHTPSEEEYSEFLDYIKEKNKETFVNEYTNILQGKNIIVIHAESLENFLIYQTILNVEGEEVEITPNFNRLAREGLYFSNFYSQQSIGTSADSEFVFNTSLLPVNNGTVYITNFDHKYVTTQSLLQQEGYTTLYFHGNNGSFWNRSSMYPIMGYDIFYERQSFVFDEEQEIGLGINDVEFFLQSVEYLKEAESPYWATLITLTNHTPWLDVDKYLVYDGLRIEPDIDCASIQLEDTSTCRYLKATRYADYAFGVFLDRLEEEGLLENTAIVVYGDHPAKLPLKDMEIFYGKELTSLEYASLSRVPFIIWSDNIEPKEITKIMAQYDVGPTLQNMLGIKNIYALGNDIFSIESNIVPFINGDWVDGIIYYSYRSDSYHIIDKDYTEEMIQEMIEIDDYINKNNEMVARIIEMSNMINKYDLIAYHEKKLLEESENND